MDRLRTVFRTANRLTLPLSGTGSAGMEASFVNFVRPGDPVVVGVNGLFGERMCEVAGRLGADVVRVDAPWGQPLDPEAAAGRPPLPADHRRGPRRDLDRCAQRRGGRSARARGTRCWSSTWSPRSAASRSRSTAGVSTSPTAARRSAWACPPGLAPAHRRRTGPGAASWTGRPAGTSTSACSRRYVEGGEGGGRVYHHTAPVTMIGALHAGLGALLEEGLAAALGPPRRVRPDAPGRAWRTWA